MFTLAYLDRTNIGLAEQAFRADTGVSDAGFALGAGLFSSATPFSKCRRT